jgi:hypothetical protein
LRHTYSTRRINTVHIVIWGESKLHQALGAWDTSIKITDSSYHTDTKILGLDITSKVNARQK